LVNIPSEQYAQWGDVIAELKAFPADIPAYIRLNVLLKGNDLLPHDKDVQIAAALQSKKGRHAAINPTREQIGVTDGDQNKRMDLTMEELRKIDPKSILISHAKASGAVFDEEFDEMFDIVFKTVNDADYEN
jgi:hypothetical protein